MSEQTSEEELLEALEEMEDLGEVVQDGNMEEMEDMWELLED